MSDWPPPTDDSLAARAARAGSPRFGYCLRCGWPWQFVEGHSTRYREDRGCFPLCESCWEILAHPEARIPYYAALLTMWESDGDPVDPDVRQDIGRAVAAGL